MAAMKRRRIGAMEFTIGKDSPLRAMLKPGAKLNVVWEPNSPRTMSPMRLLSADGAVVAQGPGDVGAWLYDLVESGRVTEEAKVIKADGHGTLVAQRPADPPTARVRLTLYLTPEGASILRRNATPANVAESLHEVVRHAFRQAQRSKSPEIATELASQIGALNSELMLPETRMLLALFDGLAAEATRRATRVPLTATRAALAVLKPAPAIQAANLTVFLLLGTNGHDAPCVLLEEAIKKEAVEVTEVDEGGDVPNLLVVNKGAAAVLVLEGDILIGAKQDRVANITVIVKAHSTLKLPVSCVEQGRWSRRSRTFCVAHSAPPDLRGRKVRSAQRTRRERGEAHSDQGDVWQSVSEHLDAVGARSETGALAGVYADRGQDIEDQRANLELAPNAVGFIAAAGGELIALEVFDSHAMLQRVWPRLSESYLVEALRRPATKRRARKVDARAFLKRVSAALEVTGKPVGAGVELTVEKDELAGSGVWFEDRLCHLAVFNTPGA